MLRKQLAIFLLGFCFSSALFADCKISTSDLNFGNYNPLSGNEVTANSAITVSCTGIVGLLYSYTVTLSSGADSGMNPRQLFNGSTKTLNYNLYQDLLYSKIWGDGTAGTFRTTGLCTVLSILVPCRVAYQVYGKIPGGQTSVSPGTYSNTVTVTLSY